MPQANADEEVAACRQPSGTSSTCMATSWAIRIGRARSSRSAERAGSRPTLVRFDDGHTGLVFPSPDAIIEHPHTKGKKGSAKG